MKRLYLTSMILSSCVYAYGADYAFRLRTIDNVDSLPVPEVRVELLANDTLPMLDKYTDKYGVFETKGIAEGEYILQLSSPGFNTFRAIFDLHKDVNLGDITLTSEFGEGMTLENVVVEGARATRDAEWLTVIPPIELAKDSYDAIALIRRLGLPGLWVTANGESMSIQGKGAPLIKVNGIKRSLAYLRTINVNNIAKVKYTDFPQADDLQEGVAGVIDIILKERENGAYAYGQVQSRPFSGKLSGNINASYNWNNSEIEVSADDNWSNVRDTRWTGWQEMSSPDRSWVDTREYSSSGQDSSNTTNLSASYTLQTNDGFQFNTTLSTKLDRSKNQNHSDTYILGTGESLIEGMAKVRITNPSIDFYTRKEWKDGRAIEANVNGALNVADNISHVSESYPGGTPYFYANNGYKARSQGIVGEVKWTQPLRNVHWTLGIKETFNHAHNTYDNGSIDNMRQSNTYLNTAIGGHTHQFSYYVGGGGSYNRQKTPAVIISDWQANATFSLNQNIGSGWLQFTGNYQPLFPTLQMLTQVKQEYGSNLDYTGNTGVKTGHYWNLNLGYFFRIKKVRIWAGVTNTHYNRLHDIQYHYLSSGKLTATRVNTPNHNVLSPNLNIQYEVTSGDYRLYYQSAFYFQHTRVSNDYGGSKLNRLYAQLYLEQSYKNFYLTFSYYSPRKSLTAYTYQYYGGSANLSLSYWWKGFMFNVSWNDMFTKRGDYSKQEWQYPLNKMQSERYTPSAGNSIEFRISWRMQYRRSFRKRNQGLSNQVVDQSVLRVL